MPNFYGETANIHKDPKMNSLARSQGGSVYGNKEELYDRLRRHAYNGNGKKGKATPPPPIPFSPPPYFNALPLFNQTLFPLNLSIMINLSFSFFECLTHPREIRELEGT